MPYERATLTDKDAAWVERIVRGWARRRQVRDCDADDLVQDVLVRVCNGMADRFDPARSKTFRRYVSSKLSHLIKDCLRKRLGRTMLQRRKRVLDRAMEADPKVEPLPLEDRLPGQVDPTAAVEVDELKGRLLTPLDDRCRKIVRLRWQGKTYQEIGDEVGVSETRICQIMKGIRRQLSA